MKKFLIIDTFNFLHRAYHALPKTLTDKNGDLTNAVYGVTSMLISVFDVIKPDYVVAALDGKKPTFRVEEFTGYKAHRKPMEDELADQIPKVFEIMDAFGIKKILVDGYEADDVIGTLAEDFSEDGLETIIVSNDKDLWQLVGKNVIVMSPVTNGKETKWVGKKEVFAHYGFGPELLADYKGLRGDPSDNIPGVYGVGEKTAKELIKRFGNVEEIYRNIDEVSSEALKKKLIECSEEAVLSKRLATIVKDVPVDVTFEDFKYHEFNKVEVKKVLEKYNFKSLIKRLGLQEEKKSKPEQIPEGQKSLF